MTETEPFRIYPEYARMVGTSVEMLDVLSDDVIAAAEVSALQRKTAEHALKLTRGIRYKNSVDRETRKRIVHDLMQEALVEAHDLRSQVISPEDFND